MTKQDPLKKIDSIRKEYQGIVGFVQLCVDMHDGIEKALERDDFIVYMFLYGGNTDGVCCGCAAACTSQHFFDKHLNKDQIERVTTRAKAYGVRRKALDSYEFTVDRLREFDMCEVYEYCNLTGADCGIIEETPENYRFYFGTNLNERHSKDREIIKGELRTLSNFIDWLCDEFGIEVE